MKTLTLILGTLLFSSTINAQKVIIQKEDGVNVETKIISIGQRNLKTPDGTYYFEEIAKIYFFETGTKAEKYLTRQGIVCVPSVPADIKLTSPNAGQFYDASNGQRYKIGDTVRLGRGSGVNGQFLYLTIGGWMAVMAHSPNDSQDKNNLARTMAGTTVVIKKIKKYVVRGTSRCHFTVDGGNITNYNLDIENAIESCEVIPCKTQEPVPVVITQPKPDKYDQLKKLKGLLDSGAITKEEYETEKKKILNEN